MVSLLWTVATLALIGIYVLDAMKVHFVGRPSIEPQPMTTDEEFTALMPDLAPEMVLKIRYALVDLRSWEPEEIHPDTRLVEFHWN